MPQSFPLLSHLILRMTSSLAGRPLWRSFSLLLFLFSFLFLFLQSTDATDCLNLNADIDFKECMGQPYVHGISDYGILRFTNATQEEVDNFFAIQPKLDNVVVNFEYNKDIRKLNLSHIDLNRNQFKILNNPSLEKVAVSSVRGIGNSFNRYIDGNGRLMQEAIAGFPIEWKKCSFYNMKIDDAAFISSCTKIKYSDLEFEKHATGDAGNAVLTDIYDCFKIEGTNLSSVSFLVGTKTKSTCGNVIQNNPFVCDADEVEANYPMNKTITSLTVSNNCQKCNLTGSAIADFSEFALCKRLYGNLFIDSKTIGFGPRQRLQKIEGCISIKGSKFTSLDFLNGTSVTGTGCTNVIEDNLFAPNIKEIMKTMTFTSAPSSKNNSGCALEGPLKNFTQLANHLCGGRFIGDLVLGKGFKDEPKNFSIKILEGCYHIKETELKTASFVMGTRTNLDCVNEIKENRLLCDTVEFGKKLVPWTRIEMEMNCEKVCYTDDERARKNCEESHGEVVFEEIGNIRRIHGALVIQKTKNSSIDFSLFSHIHYDRLVFRNNEFLCDVAAVEKAADGVEVRFEDNCWHECFSTSELRWKDCRVFNGDIYLRMGIGELGLVTKIEEIRGRLVIEGSEIEEIQWKSLRKVITKEPGPAILIQHNRRLKKVNLRGLREVESRKQPWIKITDNGEFKFTTKQWRRIMKKTGARIRFQLIVDAHPMENGNKIYYPNVVFKTPKLDEEKVNRFKYTCYATMVLEALICLYCTWWIKRWCDRETMREQFGDLHN